MVYLTHKWKKNRKYLYLEKKTRIEGKVKRVFQIYLGAEDKIEQRHILLNLDKLDSRSYNFGSAILWQMAERIGLCEIINEFTGKKRNQGLSVGDYIVICIINRCLQGCSKNSIADWIEDDFLYFQYHEYLNHLDSQGYWNHFQYFTPEILEKIQSKVTKTVLDDFKIELDLVLYDPTNFFTHQSIHKGDQIAQFGNSKEKRFDKRIVNYSLLTTKSDAIPLWHQTYDGNIHDAKHFKSTIGKITEFLEFLQYDLKELTLVLDKGNHSSESIKFLLEKSLGIITSVRPSSHKNKLQIPNRKFLDLKLRKESRTSYMKYEKTSFHSMSGTLYITLDLQMKKRSLAIFARDLKKRRSLLKEFLRNRLNDHKWTNKENVEKKLNKICGSKLFRSLFQFNIEGEEGKLVVSISEVASVKAAHCRKMGKATIFTNRTSWSVEEVVQIYRDKYVIEDSFKQMKDTRSIAIRPMYHHSNLSIHIHVFTCIMAYLLNTLTRKVLTDKGLTISDKQLQKYLSKLKVTEIGRNQLKEPLIQLNVVEGEVKKISQIFHLTKFIKDLRKNYE